MASKAKKSKKGKQNKVVPTKKSKPQKQTKQPVKQELPIVSATALVPVTRAIPVLPQRVFGRNARKPDELVVMDTVTHMGLAAMPIPIEPNERTEIAVTVGKQLMRLYDQLYKAQLSPVVVQAVEAHIACAFEAVGIACLF